MTCEMVALKKIGGKSFTPHLEYFDHLRFDLLFRGCKHILLGLPVSSNVCQAKGYFSTTDLLRPTGANLHSHCFSKKKYIGVGGWVKHIIQ
jgi:hypothetical protein